jgi:predicted nucleic acid-binding protein
VKPRAIVLDANVLMRAVLGRRVDRLLEAFAPQVTFLAPEVAFDDVREHLATVLTKRGELRALQASLDKLTALQTAVQVVDQAEYEAMKPAALARVGPRDPDDWPVLACALLLNCPIWTEDRDFFGTGVATWTTALVELYFTDPDPGPDPESADH